MMERLGRWLTSPQWFPPMTRTELDARVEVMEQRFDVLEERVDALEQDEALTKRHEAS